MTEHPSNDLLLDLAAGDGETTTHLHVEGCDPCQRRLEDLRHYLAVVRAELLELRPSCPSTDELADLPPGAEHDHAHLRECPLCREEVRLRFAAESAGRLGGDLDLPTDMPFYRAAPVVAAGGFAYQRAGGAVEMLLEEGRTAEVTIAGVTVTLRCADGELTAELSGAPERPLLLVLSNELLEKRIPLGAEGLRTGCGVFRRARVEAGADD
jgi:hypothetical protein